MHGILLQHSEHSALNSDYNHSIIVNAREQAGNIIIYIVQQIKYRNLR